MNSARKLWTNKNEFCDTPQLDEKESNVLPKQSSSQSSAACKQALGFQANNAGGRDLGLRGDWPGLAQVSRFFKKNLKKKKSLKNVTTPLMPRAPGGVSPPWSDHQKLWTMPAVAGPCQDPAGIAGTQSASDLGAAWQSAWRQFSHWHCLAAQAPACQFRSCRGLGVGLTSSLSGRLTGSGWRQWHIISHWW